MTWERLDGLPITHQAYILATAWHETARTMQPVREDAPAMSMVD